MDELDNYYCPVCINSLIVDKDKLKCSNIYCYYVTTSINNKRVFKPFNFKLNYENIDKNNEKT